MPWNNETYPAHKRMDLFLLHFSACRAPCGGWGYVSPDYRAHALGAYDGFGEWMIMWMTISKTETLLGICAHGANHLGGSRCVEGQLLQVVFQKVLAVDEWVVYEHNLPSWIQASGGILEVQSWNQWWRLGDSALISWGSIFPEEGHESQTH